MESMKREGIVFPNIGYTTLRRIIDNANKKAGTSLSRAKLRDYAYNAVRRAGMDRDIVDWLAGQYFGYQGSLLG